MKAKVKCFIVVMAMLFPGCREGPEDAFHRFMQSSINGDWSAFYDLLDAESKQLFSKSMKEIIWLPQIKLDEATKEQIKRLEGKELVVYVLSNVRQISDSSKVFSYELIEKEPLLNIAYMKTRIKYINKEKVKRIKMIKENDEWKISFKSFAHEESNSKSD